MIRLLHQEHLDLQGDAIDGVANSVRAVLRDVLAALGAAPERAS